MTPPPPAPIAAYIAGFRPPIQERLLAVRALILAVAAPGGRPGGRRPG